MKVEKLVIAGGGVLGSQIAYQAAFKGLSVTMWLREEGSIKRAEPKFAHVNQMYLQSLESLKGEGKRNAAAFGGLIDDPASLTDEKIDELKKKAEEGFKSIKFTIDMAEAMKDADVVIETIAEDPKMKVEFYTKLAQFLPEKTVIATNSSTMLPSHFAQYTGRPDKYLAMHFLNYIWQNNIAEIMGHAGTSEESFNTIVSLAEQIAMVPLKLKKEQPGYIFNSMLVPFLNSAQALWVNDVADPQTIDTTWVKATGSKFGPFQILDIVGLVTSYNIVSMSPEAGNPESLPGKICEKLKEKIDAGKTGITAGEGFYKYK